jgi:hypothetical protein
LGLTVSILLEALRKSENAQRRSKPPGINDDLPAAPAAVRSRPVLLAVAIALAVVVSGWLIWRQYRPPAGYQPPVSVPADTRAPVEKPLAAAQKERGAGTARQPETPARPPAAVAEKPAGGQRTPVETFKAPNGGAGANDGKKKPAPARDDAAKVAAALAAAQPPPAAAEPAAEKKPGKATGSEPFEPAPPAPISYWELPDAVRAQVPEIKFTVLVYARRPQDRFVLIDGQRLAEGDALPSGPKIVEIRLDGVVFSYRLYRFLVKR